MIPTRSCGVFDDPTVSGVDDPSPTASEAPSQVPSPSASPADEGPPQVADQRRVDFATTEELPTGSRIYDNESVSDGMAVERGVLQHGPPRGPVAVSSLETELSGEVSKLGARVRFVGEDPGSVVLVAWKSSFVDSRRTGQPIPATGLRLVVNSGSWELTVSPGDEVVGSGSFQPVPGTASLEVYRRDDTAWVVDPSGTVTRLQDPRIAKLAGPWACWQLVEQETSQTPAIIEAVWAG